MSIRKIIEDEIYSVLGHNPSDTEFASAVEYVKDEIRYDLSKGKRVDLTTISCYFADWRHDCCIQCAGCGDYFLADEMHTNDYGDWFCSRDCELEFAKEMEYDSEHKKELQEIWNER